MKNEVLFRRLKKSVSTERRIGVSILDLLFEVEKRRVYSELKYDGLYPYCVPELGFTDAQAFQRIQAMRALKEVPEVKRLVEAGTLSVSAVAKVQIHFRKEAKSGKKSSTFEKRDLFLAMENLSSRAVDARLAEAKGEKPKLKLFIEMDEELVETWEKVKNLSAHRTNADPAAILKLLGNEWISRNDPAREMAEKKLFSPTPKDDSAENSAAKEKGGREPALAPVRRATQWT
ncbi:MAG: hypothetical protein H7301_13365, partial [Cryobacterium sp.]|nr:hypothetical protein [Oligoflexia bacterium]